MRNETGSPSPWLKALSDYAPTIYRVSTTIIWRMMQILIIGPSTIIAMILFLSVVIGENTVHEIITGFYDFAETSVRPASPGHAIHSECADVLPPSKDIQAPAICNSFKNTETLISEDVANITDKIYLIYWMLVVVSIGLLIAFYPSRQKFFDLRSAMKEKEEK